MAVGRLWRSEILPLASHGSSGVIKSPENVRKESSDGGRAFTTENTHHELENPELGAGKLGWSCHRKQVDEESTKVSISITIPLPGRSGILREQGAISITSL